MITIIKQHNNKYSLSLRERVGVREQQTLATEVTDCMGEVLRSPERTEKLRLKTVYNFMSSRIPQFFGTGSERDLVLHRTRSLTGASPEELRDPDDSLKTLCAL